MTSKDAYFMRLALEEARNGKAAGEVPVGAVLASADGNVLAAAQNEVLRRPDPGAHAEMLAMQKAARKIMNCRLLMTTLYVTIEPCIMCMGAMIHARIGRLVFGAADPKWGAAGSLYNFASDHRLNHRIEVCGGVMEADARTLIQDFFKCKRG